MHSERTVVELVGLIYDAAVDPALWVPFLERLEQVLRTPWCVFHVHDLARHTCDVTAEIGFDPAFRRSYEQYYVSRNAFFIHGKKHLWPGNVCTDLRLCPDRVLFRSEFYNDWLAPQGMLRGINATVLKTDSLVSLLGLVRRKDADPPDRDDVTLVERLMPHLQRAVQLHRRLTDLHARERSARDALDSWPLGVILLDGKGSVLLMNKAAEDLVRRNDGLSMERERLRATRADETIRLRALIGKAIARSSLEPDAGGVTTLSRANSDRPLHLLVAPLSQAAAREPRPACMVFVSDPDAAPKSNEKYLQRLYGLTLAESKLAALLIQGKDVKDIADQLHVTLNTARTHLKRIFDKTNTKRQAELISLLLRGPLVRRRR
jgi:DNA-binding CsgD family transcriptional regulator